MKKVIPILLFTLLTNHILGQNKSKREQNPKTEEKPIIGDTTEALPHSTIYFVRTFNYFSTSCRNLITVSNQEQFMLGNSSLVNYEIYSQGEVKIIFEYINSSGGGSGSSQVILDVKRGESYYLYCNGFSLKQVEEKEVDRPLRKTKNVIYLKEDLEYPIDEESVADIPNGGGGQGTCFLISQEGYFITNFHCVENTKEITISGIDGDFSTKYGATLVASDPTNDLALLKITNKNVVLNSPPFEIRTSGVQQAEKIYALGFPYVSAMGAELKITEGIISSKSGVQGDISKYQISAAVNPGNSGGPLIDENGNLIGVIYAKSTVAESASYAIKAGYLELFLKNVESFKFPEYVNTLQDKTLPEKVASLKNYIFIVESK